MICKECGMLTDLGEYHPYAACLMFKGCSVGQAVPDCGDVVRANLDAVVAHGYQQATEEQKRLAEPQGDEPPPANIGPYPTVPNAPGKPTAANEPNEGENA